MAPKTRLDVRVQALLSKIDMREVKMCNGVNVSSV